MEDPGKPAMPKVKKTKTQKNGKRAKQPLYPTQRGPAPSGVGQRGSTPLARHARLVSGIPKRGYHAAGEIVSNCEFLGDATINCDALNLGELFQTKSYRINAGDRTTFPWLSVVAQGYEYYKFEKLEFIYISREPATKEGVILMVIDTDPSDPRPSNSQELMVAPRAATDVVWADLSCTAPPAALNNFVANGGHGYYVSNGEDAQGSDLRLIDSGTFWFASEGYQHTLPALAAKTVGSILVRYTVKLSIPNSEKRLVVNGTPANPVTQPPGLLPVVSRLFDAGANTALVKDAWKRILLGDGSPIPSGGMSIRQFAATTAKDLVLRNLAQYWNAALAAFVMPKGRWQFDVTNTTMLVAPATSIEVEQFLTLKAHRPETAETVILDCTRNTNYYTTSAGSLYNTQKASAIVQTEEGDLVWPEAMYMMPSGGVDPTNKLFISTQDPVIVTMSQLGV
jgi:hypothetical protein